MSSPRSIAYRSLNADHTDDKGPIEFYDSLVCINEELAELEHAISETSLDVTGFHAQQELSEYESKYTSLKKEIKEAQQAVIYRQPTELERFDNELLTPITKDEFTNYTDKFNRQIQLLEKRAYRVGEQLEGKRNSANARMNAMISVCAVTVSTLTLLFSAFGVI